MNEQESIDIIRQRCRPLQPIPTDTAPVLQRLDDICAVLFDIYGTLFVSASGDIGVSSDVARGQAMAGALRAAAIDSEVFDHPDSAAAVADCFVKTITADHAAKRAAGIDFPEVDIVEIWRLALAAVAPQLTPSGGQLERLAVHYEVRTNPVWPMPGLVECLDGLADSGRLLGLISNAQFYTPLLFPALLGRTLDELAVDPNVKYYSYSRGEAKPGEALYRLAEAGLAERGILPGQTLYVGNDMLNDIMPAARVGFRTALFAGDRRSLRMRDGDPRVAGVTPDIVVTELTSLLSCVAAT